MEEWKSSKREKRKKEIQIEEPKIPTRSSTPPKKSEDYNKWFDWYQEEIRERLAKGENYGKIRKDLNILHIDKFMNNER